jgi:hypothetical protein
MGNNPVQIDTDPALGLIHHAFGCRSVNDPFLSADSSIFQREIGRDKVPAVSFIDV